MTVSTLRLNGPEDVIDLLPYLVGFEVAESLVLVWMKQNRITLTARLDITCAEHLPELRQTMRAQQLRTGATAVIGIAVCGSREVAGLALGALLDTCGADVVDAIYACGDRWWSLLCGHSTCCPEEGNLWDPSGSVMAAEAVFAGMSKVGRREDLAALVLPSAAEADREELGLAIAELADVSPDDRTCLMLGLLEQLRSADEVTREQAARMSVLLVDPRCRDIATLELTADNADRLIRQWSQIVRQTPAYYCGPALLELALAAWVGGSGALMNMALDLARVHAPEHPLLAVVEDIYTRMVPPSMWDELRTLCA